ncbi:hypothetical protein [Tropicimonas isoalkanivorans]|uniref:Glycosyl transferase family 2 n=1 Tax=Tropicimonas isoalkanivorans TaxID=441112 RepID=A0A1I1PUX6_9RHOB|nr:hypothetical protein [Tropicimonas isoalkanivorans]SFD13701.1 hypothetical protein SAMN04488094_11680 [Tropicimonas isoalkanivorans]
MDLPDFSIAEMQSLSVEGSGRRRHPSVPEAARSEDFGSSYDWTTLWYDAVQRDGELLLICPKLLNFKAFISDGALRADGSAISVSRVRHHRRHDVVRLRTRAPVTRLETSNGRWRRDSGVSPDQSALFAGLNASVHISRNNRLDWIADWARFHIGEHGLEAMLVLDNGSDAYPPQAILDTLASTGLKRVVILKVPHPYGPVRQKKRGGGAKFLQPAMLNLARLRFLYRARAVLNADLDELVWTRAGSVFDAAVQSRLGFVTFDGRWRMPAIDAEAPYRHSDHRFQRATDKPCPTKYCLRPDSWLGRQSWDVHHPEVLLPLDWLARKDMGYWHCRGITTNWKSYDRLGFNKVGPEDPFTAETLDRLLPNR